MTLEEALAAAQVNDAGADEVITIDNDLRKITIPASITLLGVESDENVQTLHFQMPKTYKGLDLSEFAIRINYMNANNVGDVYAVDDNEVSGDNITFTWTVGRVACMYKGNTKFIVCLKKKDASGNVLKEFNTSLTSLPVLEGLETTEAVVSENPDIIEQILTKIEKLTQISPEDIASAVSEYMKENPINVPKNLSDLKEDAEHRTVTDAEKHSWNAKSDFSGEYRDLQGKPELAEWALQSEKPTYTASEVGALPNTTKIPSKTSDLQNDSGFTKLALDETLTNNTKAAPAGMVGELKSDLVEFTSYSRQYIDTSKSTDGYVWTAWGGNLKKETNTSGYQNYTAYDGIYLKANISYHFTNIHGYYSYLFKMNGEYISNISQNANLDNSNYDYIPTEDCVVYITAQTIYKGIRTFLYVGSNAPSSFVYGVYDKSIKEDVSLPPLTEVEAKIAKCFQESTSSQIISNEQLASLDDCDNNKIYRINCSDLSSAPANSPNNRGILFTIGFNKDGQQTLSQFFYGIDGLLNIRYKWGTSWRPWKILSDRNYADSILQSAKDYADSKSIDFSSVDFGFIERFAVVGDSYASGEIYISDGGSGYIQHDYYNLSWGQIMARKYGNICLNLSSGGLSTRTWLTSKKGLALLNSSEPQQLYMCMLGANDIDIGADYIGSIDDIRDDSSQNADSFYGNYGKIISAIKTKAPNAKIVLMTVAYEWGTLEDNFNNAIKTIANHFSIPCIDVKTDVFYSRTGLYQTGKRWNHPTAPLYAGMASANVRLFNKCVEDNYSYFRDYVG